MMLGQLSNRESLRGLIALLQAHQAKCYHLGLEKVHIVKTTFATVNLYSDYCIFEDYAFYMMDLVRKKRIVDM